MNNDSEIEIIEAVLSGDKQAYSRIVELYQAKILRYCSCLLGFHREDAEDVASDVFVKAFINLARYNQSLAFSSWLYRIAHNEAINYMKKNRRVLSIDMQTTLHEIPTDFDFDAPHASDLEKILARMKEKDRNLLILFHLEEKSIKEIAEILKTTENSIKAQLSQARQKARHLANQPFPRTQKL